MTTTRFSKLTPEDVDWLERQLIDAIEPIEPRREFVTRAREQLMEIELQRPLPSWVKPSALTALVLSLLALIGTLFYLRHRDE